MHRPSDDRCQHRHSVEKAIYNELSAMSFIGLERLEAIKQSYISFSNASKTIENSKPRDLDRNPNLTYPDIFW
jgi:hypothetical protein